MPQSRESQMPDEQKIGKNCAIDSSIGEEAYSGKSIEDGEGS